MTKLKSDGAPPDYDHPYDDAEYNGPWDYPIQIRKKWMPRDIKSPYSGPDLIGQYLSWVNAGESGEMEALNQGKMLDDAFTNLNDSAQKFGYVLLFVVILLLTKNFLFSLPAFYYFFQGSSLFVSFLTQAGQATPRGLPSVNLSTHYIYLSLVVLVTLGGVVLVN